MESDKMEMFNRGPMLHEELKEIEKKSVEYIGIFPKRKHFYTDYETLLSKLHKQISLKGSGQ